MLIKYLPGEGKPPVPPEEVREFVAKAVPELNKDNVKVLMIESITVKRTDAELEQRMVSHLGVRLEKASVSVFRALIALPTLLFLAVTGVLAFVMVRKPAPASNGNGRRKAPPPDEG